MKFLIFGAILASLSLQGATSKNSGAAPAALKTFLERQGFGGSPLQRRFGNHLFATTLMNGHRTALMIDTGCPYTLIDRASVGKLGLIVQNTRSRVGGVFGWKSERFGASKLRTLAMGNCTFTNVPITVADESDINEIRGPHLDGLFGVHEMATFGIVVDCTRQMLYVNPKGASPTTSQNLAEFLGRRGFSRIPMRFSPEHHLEIGAGINGHPVKLIVDTGSSTTLLAASATTEYGASISKPNLMMRQSGGIERIGIGYIKELELGSLRVPNAEIVIANIARQIGVGLLGEEYLSWNFAIVDVGGMNLYLRPPESAPKKSR